MNILTIFGTQLFLSLFVYALIARWYVSPWLADKPLNTALILLILPHAFRHVGLTFLVPGVAGGVLPEGFAAAAAYGDFISGLLAILAVIALKGRWSLAIPLVWIFNIIGTVDLLNALRHADVQTWVASGTSRLSWCRCCWSLISWFLPACLSAIAKSANA